MNYSTYYRSLVRRIYVEKAAADSSAIALLLERMPGTPVHYVDTPADIPAGDRTGSTMFLHAQRGLPVTRCPGTKEHCCCNYLTVDLYSGCPIGCTYCIMRSYLNFSPVSVVADPEAIVTEIRRIALENPATMIRVGSGETGDSLLYDPLLELSRVVIEGVSDLDNVFFEMKTKTALVDHLLPIGEKGNAVVGFSIAPQTIIDAEEGSAASLEERLDAAQRASEAGFLIAFHFDPMFYRDDWQDLYPAVARKLSRFSSAGREARIAWISLGTFRFPPELKEKISKRPYLYAELVPSLDGNYRYPQRVRREMFSAMRKELLSVVRAPVYLCMESEAVWKRAFGGLPAELKREAPLFEFPEL